MHTSEMDKSTNNSMEQSKKLPGDNERMVIVLTIINTANIAYSNRTLNVQLDKIEQRESTLIHEIATISIFIIQNVFKETQQSMLSGRLVVVSTNQTL